MIVRQIDHIGIAVRDLERSLEKYERLLGARPDHIEVREDLHVRFAFIPIGEVMIELLQPTSPGKGRVGEFIESHGEGFHHIAYRISGDLSAVLADIKESGVRLKDEQPRAGGKGSRIAFISPEEMNGVLIELVQRNDGS